MTAKIIPFVKPTILKPYQGPIQQIDLMSALEYLGGRREEEPPKNAPGGRSQK